MNASLNVSKGHRFDIVVGRLGNHPGVVQRIPLGSVSADARSAGAMRAEPAGQSSLGAVSYSPMSTACPPQCCFGAIEDERGFDVSCLCTIHTEKEREQSSTREWKILSSLFCPGPRLAPSLDCRSRALLALSRGAPQQRTSCPFR